MEEKAYTNRELAEDYFIVVRHKITDSGISDTYRSLKKIIAESSIDLPTFYREHGDLKELMASGIGKKTKKILELILENGTEEARRLLQEEPVHKIWQGVPRKIKGQKDDYGPSWEDAIRRHEA